MHALRKVITLSILAIGLMSCTAVAPQPAQTPLPTATSLPTATDLPTPTSLPTATATPEPSRTPIPTEKPTQTALPPTEAPAETNLSLPTGKPVASWEGLPIMPGALAGDADGSGYTFTIQATPDEVQKFYQNGLAKLGWKLFASGQGTSTTEPQILFFMKGSGSMTVSMIPQPGGLMLVMLIKV